jgi:hypothetical protein
MDDGLHVIVAEEVGKQCCMSNVAPMKGCRRRDERLITGREVVDYHHPLARIAEPMGHMAADIPSTAGHQYRHECSLPA